MGQRQGASRARTLGAALNVACESRLTLARSHLSTEDANVNRRSLADLCQKIVDHFI